VTGKPVSSAVVMNRDQIWQAIDAQRTSLTDLLEQLADDEWLQPSLCAGWTVRDVAAHLTLQQLGPGATLGMMFKWQGSLDRTIQHVARLRAVTLTTGQNHRRDPGHDRLTAAHLRRRLPRNPHRHPRAQPGHRAAPRPRPRNSAGCRGGRGQPGVVDALAAATPLGTEMAGVRLSATDTSSSAGDGPEVRAPMAALLLVCCGRLAALPQLSGEAAPDLAARLSTPTPA